MTHRLSTLTTSDQARRNLQRYFGAGAQHDGAPFTGSRFKYLAGGGDCPAVANTVTADDLIAVQTLSVRIYAQAALDLLEGDLGVRLSKLLSGVRVDIDMVEAEAAELADGSPAHAAWHLLRDQAESGGSRPASSSPESGRGRCLFTTRSYDVSSGTPSLSGSTCMSRCAATTGPSTTS